MNEKNSTLVRLERYVVRKRAKEVEERRWLSGSAILKKLLE